MYNVLVFRSLFYFDSNMILASSKRIRYSWSMPNNRFVICNVLLSFVESGFMWPWRWNCSFWFDFQGYPSSMIIVNASFLRFSVRVILAEKEGSSSPLSSLQCVFCKGFRSIIVCYRLASIGFPCLHRLEGRRRELSFEIRHQFIQPFKNLFQPPQCRLLCMRIWEIDTQREYENGTDRLRKFLWSFP